ncbi:hypothetical protein [Microvirga sp. P5_D2]
MTDTAEMRRYADLIEREGFPHAAKLLRDAAAEIERLRAALSVRDGSREAVETNRLDPKDDSAIGASRDAQIQIPSQYNGGGE